MSTGQTIGFTVTALMGIMVAAVFVYALIKGLPMWMKRQKELPGWAKANGLTLNSAKDYSICSRLPDFQCLHMDHHSYAWNVAEGMIDGRPVCVFDYSYKSGSHRRSLSAVMVNAGLPLKPLLIRADKTYKLLGFEDTDFESAAFSQRYIVNSPDRRWAYDVLNQKTIELILCYPPFDYEFRDGHVIAYVRQRFLSLGDINCALKVVTGMLDNLPPGIVEEMKAMHGKPGS